MKKELLATSCLIISLGMIGIAQADTTAAPSLNSPSMTATPTVDPRVGKHACMNIASACESAGFRLSKTMVGKNIWKDCVNPILAGQTIAGVTPTSADVQACSTHKANWMSKHNMQANTPSTMAPSMDSSAPISNQ